MHNNINKKRCGRCKHYLPATSKYFAKDSTRKSGLNSYCRICKRLSDVGREKKLRVWFYNLKKTKVCERCGESRWYTLDFHHIVSEEKTIGITQMVYGNNRYNKEDVLEEMKKCQILCANCHREEHFLNPPDFKKSNVLIINFNLTGYPRGYYNEKKS